MKVKSVKVSFEDARGKITDILVNENIKHVTVITFMAGAIRGNHVHNRTEQYNYIMEGRLRVITQLRGGRKKSRIIEAGEMFFIPRRERHAMIAIKRTLLLVMTRGVRGGKDYELDTLRLKGRESLI